ncbi:hypothetical protein Ciccas_005653 [Cichlidogyrus casuarinus]|uniref:Uncharacterized protein n=1 Tax=Cichlidogyrus casuarinus TaxID=1844966 RepID=A0ABD2QBP5_9PLAT
MALLREKNKARKEITLLGHDSSCEEKRKRAFTIQALQGIWDCGKPICEADLQGRISPSNANNKIKRYVSAFSQNYQIDRYPFRVDHGMTLSEPRLIWTVPISQVEGLFNIMVDLLEGLKDWDKIYQGIAMSALTDIFRHVSTETIQVMFPKIIDQLLKLVRVDPTVNVSFRVVDICYRMIRLHSALSPDFVRLGMRVMKFCMKLAERKECCDLMPDLSHNIRSISVKIVDLLNRNCPKDKEAIFSILM